jgi:hypothetical protein
MGAPSGQRQCGVGRQVLGDPLLVQATCHYLRTDMRSVIVGAWQETPDPLPRDVRGNRFLST